MEKIINDSNKLQYPMEVRLPCKAAEFRSCKKEPGPERAR